MGRCSYFSPGEADHQRAHSQGQGCSRLCKSTTPSFPRRCSQASRPSLASCCHWSFKGGRGSMGHGSKLCAPVLGPWVSCCVDWAWAQLITGKHGISCSTLFQLCVFQLYELTLSLMNTIHSYVLGCLPFASVGSSVLCHTLESTGTFPLHTLGEVKGLD